MFRYKLILILLCASLASRGQSPMSYLLLNKSVINPIIWLDASNSSSYSGSGTTWYDLTSSAANGTLTGSPTFNSTAPKNFSFNGTNQYVNISNRMALNYNGDITISCWVNLASLPSSGAVFYTISDIGNSGGAENYLRIKYVSGSDIELQFGIYVPSNDYLVQSNIFSLLSTNTWYNIVGTVKSGVWSTYFNGSFVASNSTTNGYAIGTSSYASIMAYNSGASRYFNGKLSQIQYYNTALTSAKVLANFNSQKTYYGY